MTGKPTSLWGSFGRTEATGYGLIYFANEALKNCGLSLAGSQVVVSGSGNVSTYAVEKATELGAKVIAVSDSQGYVVDYNGVTSETLKELKKRGSGALKYYTEYQADAECFEGESVWDAEINYDFAFPCATQNEINKKKAQDLVENYGVKALFEGANMPSTDGAIQTFKENNVLFGPAKAANAGGVAVSGLEMAQNAQMEQWIFEVVDERLQSIMKRIYFVCSYTAEKYVDDKHNLQAGANIAGFARVVHIAFP